MDKRKMVWSVSAVAAVAALLFVASSFAAPHAMRFDGTGRAPIAAPTSVPPARAVAPMPEPIANAAATSTSTQPEIALVSTSPAPVAQIPNAAEPLQAPSRAPAAAPARDTASIWFGLYVPGAPSSMQPVSASESRVDRHAAVVNFFVADSEQFPTSRCANIVGHGSTPLITLEFWSIGSAGLNAINDGSKDAYIRRFADNAKAFHKTIWLRPFHEMNTHHYPWGNTGSNTPAKLVAAYRRVHGIFAAEGATNVKFVWCPNIDYGVRNYFPGDKYVDYAAIDGYNTGKPWRSFSSLFGQTYESVRAVTRKPIFVAETACAASPRKAEWVTDMFDQIASAFPRIAGVCWFDENKEQDWRVNSSPGSAAAVRAALARF